MYQKIKAANLLTMIDAVESASAQDSPEFVMDLYDDKWIVMSKDESNVILASVLVPRTAMDEYDRNNYDALAMDTGRLKSFIEDSSSIIEMQLDQRRLHIREGGVEAELATLDPENVTGKASQSPKIEHEVKVKGGLNNITDFIRRVEGVLNTGSYYLGAREDGVYLYSRGDNGQMSKRIPWDDLDGHEIDWSINNKPPGKGHVPQDDHAVDSILSIDFTKSLNTLEGDVKLGIGNHIPLRILYQNVGDSDEDSGMMVNYYQTPRIDEGEGSTIPQKIIEKNR